MIVTLIPFLLAATIGVNKNDWKYGPEVIYDVRVDAKSYPPGKYGTAITISNMTTKLNCRPKSPSKMSCHFHESRYEISRIKPPGVKPQFSKISPPKDEDFGDDIFELNYMPNGLHSIVVSSSMKLPTLDMIRALVGQLNIGGDLSLTSDDEFQLVENFTTGSCKTNYHLVAIRDDADEPKEKKNDSDDYEIVNLIEMPPGEIKEIIRLRNLDKCRRRINYFYGIRHNLGIPLDRKLKTSMSIMTLRKRDFTSWTENSVTMSSDLHSITSAHIEKITLSLEKIVPAKNPLPMITHPWTMSIYPGDYYKSDSSKEKNDFN